MKIAIPLVNCRLANQFGHCTSFALFDVDMNNRAILRRQDIPSPPHQPDLLPGWLAERRVNMVIAGGLGKRAMTLLKECGIDFVVGSEKDAPEKIIAAYLDESLQLGENHCDGCFTVKITFSTV